MAESILKGRQRSRAVGGEGQGKTLGQQEQPWLVCLEVDAGQALHIRPVKPVFEQGLLQQFV